MNELFLWICLAHSETHRLHATCELSFNAKFTCTLTVVMVTATWHPHMKTNLCVVGGIDCAELYSLLLSATCVVNQSSTKQATQCLDIDSAECIILQASHHTISCSIARCLFWQNGFWVEERANMNTILVSNKFNIDACRQAPYDRKWSGALAMRFSLSLIDRV